MTPQTIPLFPDLLENCEGPVSILADIIRNMTWSYSRRQLLEQCPLRYYYAYYGSNSRNARDDPQKEKLRFLKKLQNRHERAGQILHLVIATYLRKANSGDLWSPNRLSEWAKDLFDKDLRYSMSLPDGSEQHKETYPPVLLREFHYRLPDARRLCEDSRDRLLASIEAFTSSPVFSSFRDAANSPGALIEHRANIRNLPCKVDGRLDLAYWDHKELVIVDWKLGQPGYGDDSLQLAAYALWACERFQIGAGEVQLYKAHLTSGELVQSQVTDSMLSRGRGRIIQDAERMAAMDNYGKTGQAEAFSPCAQVAVCSLCPFQKACPEGKRFIDVGD